MQYIEDKAAAARWTLNDGERLMIGPARIENGQSIPVEHKMFAYGYVPNGGPNQYRLLGECDKVGMPLEDKAVLDAQPSGAPSEEAPAADTTPAPEPAPEEIPLPA